MSLLIILLGLFFVLSFWIGFQRMLRLQHLTQRRLINGFIVAMVILTILTAGQWMDLLSNEISAKFTMMLYCSVAGFFCGFALKMIFLRRKIQAIDYVHRSFWTDAAPNIIAVLIIAFGLYRTGILTLGPYSGIGITSGLSLLGFGCFGLTVKIVPEFRRKGILILDQLVPWEKVVAYQWQSEQILKIDYYTETDELTDFTTYIPRDDELLIERLLSRKLKEHQEERKKEMSQTNDHN